MKIFGLCLGLVLVVASTAAFAADAGIVTIAQGSARVLRGTVWYRLVAGAPIQEGDLIDAGERTQVQIELASGGTVHIVGPAGLFAASIPVRNEKQDAASEFGLDKGWMKVVSPAAAPGVRVRTAASSVNTGDATFVMHQDSRTFELFIESGSARIAETNRTGRDGAVHDAKAGEYWSRDADKPFLTERRAPPQFVSSMPHDLMDRLVNIASRFKGQKPSLAADREITLAEADPWLAGPYRRVFARRLSSRLADPAFRKGVETNLAAYPDFDRVLHPEKYPPTQAGPAPMPNAPVAPAPAQASPQRPGQRSALTTMIHAATAFAQRSSHI